MNLLAPLGMERVQKLLARYGYCSRRKAEELIAAGRVTVNGVIVALGAQASEDDAIAVDGTRVEPQRMRYLAYHKPVGLITALRDDHERTIFDELRIEERVVPVGRLDKWTSGLLILTNDGDFANRIAHPRYETEKEYAVTAPHPVSDRQLERLAGGLELDDGPTPKAAVNRIDASSFSIAIHEGRNRIVRRMCEAVGIRVSSLERVRIGGLQIGDLEPGACRDLSEQDRRALLGER